MSSLRLNFPYFPPVKSGYFSNISAAEFEPILIVRVFWNVECIDFRDIQWAECSVHMKVCYCASVFVYIIPWNCVWVAACVQNNNTSTQCRRFVAIPQRETVCNALAARIRNAAANEWERWHILVFWQCMCACVCDDFYFVCLRWFCMKSFCLNGSAAVLWVYKSIFIFFFNILLVLSG